MQPSALTPPSFNALFLSFPQSTDLLYLPFVEEQLMYLLIFVSFASLVACGDLTTRRAIEKRGRQINLKCIENRQQLQKCSNRVAVDEAWNLFEHANENYSMGLDSCKEAQREKRDCKCIWQETIHKPHHRGKLTRIQEAKFDRQEITDTEKVRGRRHDYGSNDDKKDEEEMPEAKDYSKDFTRSRRYTCLEDANREKTRLFEKFASLCDKKTV
ncbi:unnamed protein product [Gongylonema pulchrum]|uniref:Uncharacterized protein n=1 Tax=Gongylonema pulchrum TaxID=637853 RepID=A0A183CXD9_9BILA|nr:unnamed protein product [Gongylonema pulchrum]